MKTETAIKYFGSIAKLASAMNYSRQAIYLWGEDVPDGAAHKLQVITGGNLQVHIPEKDRRSKPGAGRSLTGAKSKVGGRKMAGSRSVAK